MVQRDPSDGLFALWMVAKILYFWLRLTFDEQKNDDDFVVEKDGVTLLVDAMSMQYLNGSTIDYSKTLMAEQFEIKNPNATSKCGCGSSFSA